MTQYTAIFLDKHISNSIFTDSYPLYDEFGVAFMQHRALRSCNLQSENALRSCNIWSSLKNTAYKINYCTIMLIRRFILFTPSFSRRLCLNTTWISFLFFAYSCQTDRVKMRFIWPKFTAARPLDVAWTQRCVHATFPTRVLGHSIYVEGCIEFDLPTTVHGSADNGVHYGSRVHYAT